MTTGSPDYLRSTGATHAALGKVRSIAYLQNVHTAEYDCDTGEYLQVTITGKGIIHAAIFVITGAAPTNTPMTINPDSKGSLISLTPTAVKYDFPTCDAGKFKVLQNDSTNNVYIFSFHDISFNTNCVIKMNNVSGATPQRFTIFVFYSCESGGTSAIASTGDAVMGTSAGGSASGAGSAPGRIDL